MKRIVFSANDPGGAHAILPVVAALRARGDVVTGFLTGPAVSVFEAASIPGIVAADSLSDEEVFRQIDAFHPHLFLAGTSGGTLLDKRILLHLKGTPSVYVLDYWNNYWQRFSGAEKDFAYLPSLICVPDVHAATEMRAEGFDPRHIVVTGNPYFETFADSVTRVGERRDNVLYISQPLSADADLKAQYGFDEFVSLEGLIQALSAVLPDAVLSIRLHPREQPQKFDMYLTGHVEVSKTPTLEEALSRAGLVVGMYSPVLLQAAIAGKSVISYQPNGTADDPLPSNRVGATVRATTVGELSAALKRYKNGGTLGDPSRVMSLITRDSVTHITESIARLIS